jgi:dTDP-glucose 4,6-dehydratase
VDDHASAIWSVLTGGEVGNVYNIGGSAELPNITVVRCVLQCLGKPESLIKYVQDRAGHDRRYAMNTDRICKELGWRPGHRVDVGIAKTVEWYLEHRTWWERVLSEAYRATNSLYLTSV